MRICLISREYPPDTGWGGIGAYTYQHAHGLKALGHDVEVVALTKKEQCVQQSAEVLDGIIVHRAVWGPLLNDLSMICLTAPYTHYVLKCAMALWQKFLPLHQANPFDVVEAPEHLAEAILPALTKVCPLVIRLHTPHFKFTAERYHNLSPTFDLQTVANFERMAMLEADLLSSPSEDLARYVSQDFGYRLEDIKIVRNPVDIGVFNPEGPRAYGDGRNPVVFFAGRLEGRKGIYFLFDAIPKILAKCPGARFLIVGADTNTASGEKSVLSELKAKLAGLSFAVDAHSGADLNVVSAEMRPVLSAVEFVSHVPLDKMADYYRSASVCVVPSLYDNAPYTVLEAMACAKPIVGSKIGGIPEYVLDGETGIIVPAADSEALAKGIIELLQDDELRSRYGEAARKRIEGEFTREIIARQAIDTYEIAIAKFRQGHALPVFRRRPEEIIESFVSSLYAYERSLDRLVFDNGLELLSRRAFQLLTLRPRLALAKVVLGFLQLLGKLPLLAGFTQNLADKLDRRVKARELEAEDKIRKRLYSFFNSAIPTGSD